MDLYPQDAELNWGPRCYSAGIERRLAEAIAAYQKFLSVDGGKLATEEYQARHRLPVLEDLLRHQKKK